MTSATLGAASVSGWWRQARVFFAEHVPEAVPQLDDEATRLERLMGRDEDVVVCVLGHAAVGKSTLLNALVAGSETVLPAGGVGPLTALATKVRFSEEPYFQVRYKDARQLQGVRLALEAELRRQGRALEPVATAEAADAQSPLAILEGGSSAGAEGLSADDAGYMDETEAARVEHRGALDNERRKRVDELVQQVRQVVKGDQFAEFSLEELVAGFRMVLGLATLDLPPLSEHDDVRVRQAAAVLAAGRNGSPVLYSKAELGAEFATRLSDHASGSLAPLISEIEVGWPSDVLRNGLVLVDLPGVGVASDRHGAVTSEFVRERARAVVLVVDKSGPTDDSVELIRESGYWDRLLLSSDDPDSDPCALVIAVSKTDEVALEEYRAAAVRPTPEQRPKPREILARLRVEMERKIRAQAALGFGKLSQAATDDEHVRTARNEAVKALLASLRVFALSATQYRDLVAGDEVLRPFVFEVGETGVPQLQGHLTRLAADHRTRLAAARNEVAARLLRTASANLDSSEALWSDNLRATEEAVRLRDELDRFLEPKRVELANREGAFREFLEATAGTRIDELVAKAQASARAEVDRYLQNLGEVHWATLRATVTRGGAHVSSIGRRIDLVADLAQRFQEPMAAVWGQTLLRQIRSRTQAHGRALETIVREICEWADQRSETRAQGVVIAAQQELIRGRVEQLGQIGHEAIDELKDAIKRDLADHVAGPIRDDCESFVARGDAYGPGVKRRILTLFRDLSQTAVAAAAIPAARLLKRRFSEVQFEIVNALAEWGDPIEQAANAVVEREESRLRRSDAQRRAKVLRDLADLRGAMPVPLPKPEMAA